MRISDVMINGKVIPLYLEINKVLNAARVPLSVNVISRRPNIKKITKHQSRVLRAVLQLETLKIIKHYNIGLYVRVAPGQIKNDSTDINKYLCYL